MRAAEVTRLTPGTFWLAWPALDACCLAWSSRCSAQANSVARTARPATTRTMPGPGVTNITRPTASSATPTTNTAARLLLRQMNRTSVPNEFMVGQGNRVPPAHTFRAGR